MRTIPYGYGMKGGVIVIMPEEAEVVKRIFKEYIGGLSYKKLAKKLNDEKIIYSDGCEKWGLGTVKKLVVREHYIGKNGYPRIISDEDYYTAQKLSKERIRAIGGPTADLAEIKKKAVCGECGRRLERFGSRYKGVGTFYWRCINPDCSRLGFSITDKTLTAAFDNAILSAERKNDVAAISYEPDGKVIYQQNQINQMLDSDKADYDRIKDEIVKLTALKYDCIDYKCSEKQAERISILIANYEPDIEKRAEFVKECVSKIVINNACEFIVKLIDGTVIKYRIERTSKK